MQAARLESVDLWIATGGRDVAALVLPVLKPKAYLPVHWDGLFGAFKAGPPQPYADAGARDACSRRAGCGRSCPVQYMDRWRLDRQGRTGARQPRDQAEAGFPLMRIAFLGLGKMGTGMAARLLAAGQHLRSSTARAARAAPFEKLGARVADSPRSAAPQADIIIGMTADDESSRAMWLGEDGALAADNAPDALAIECSTLSHDWVLELARKVRAARFPLRGRAGDRTAGCGGRRNADTAGGRGAR